MECNRKWPVYGRRGTTEEWLCIMRTSWHGKQVHLIVLIVYLFNHSAADAILIWALTHIKVHQRQKKVRFHTNASTAPRSWGCDSTELNWFQYPRFSWKIHAGRIDISQQRNKKCLQTRVWIWVFILMKDFSRFRQSTEVSLLFITV